MILRVLKLEEMSKEKLCWGTFETNFLLPILAPHPPRQYAYALVIPTPLPSFHMNLHLRFCLNFHLLLYVHFIKIENYFHFLLKIRTVKTIKTMKRMKTSETRKTITMMTPLVTISASAGLLCTSSGEATTFPVT